jgi:uncharacterized glyoxalase superfamily protein PhnB
MSVSTSPISNVFPFLRCRNAPAQIDWLCKAFGFEIHMTVPGDGGTIAHAELRLGAGIVMLGSERDDDFQLSSALDLGGVNQGIYVCLREIDDHCVRARAAGAEIVREPFDTDYGSRDYIARDPEGNLWAFGTYNPLVSDGT